MPSGDKVKFGIALPQIFPNEPIDMEMVGKWTRRAEELGFESLWTQEGILSDTASLEPLTQLSYTAALTTKVRLGVSVMVAPLRNPVQLAKSLSSLDHMSGGRLIAGVGIGNRMDDFKIFGLSPEKRVRRYIEVLDVMKALWTQKEAHFQGEFWQLDGTTMEPKPVQKPYPPIWFGGRDPKALRRAVRHGDGFMGAGYSNTAQFATCVGHIRTFLEESGKDPSTFPLSKRVYLAVDNDENRAERRLQEWFTARYHDAAGGSRVAIWGSAAKCTEKLAEVIEAGADMLMLNPVFDHMEHLEVLAEEVMPNL